MTSNDFDPWSRVDPTLYSPASPVATHADPEKAAKRNRAIKRVRLLGDVIGSLFWLYVVLKLFVFDVDVALLGSLGVGWLADYRITFFLVAIALAALILRRYSFFLAAYVCLFPFIVSFWKIPRLLYKYRSWTGFFNILNLATSVVYPYRYRLSFLALFIGSVLLTVTAAAAWALLLAATIFGCLLLSVLCRSIVTAINASKFLKFQYDFFAKLVSGKFAKGLMLLDSSLKEDEIEKYSSAQLDQFVQKVAIGVSASRLVRYWAFRLDKYRQGPSVLILSMVSYLWIFVTVAILLTLANWSVAGAYPLQFGRDVRPGFAEMFHYSLSALALNGVDGISPVGSIALWIKIAAGFLGPTVLVTLVLHLVIAMKSPRQDEYIKQAAAEARLLGSELEEELHAEYRVTPEEAARRITEFAGNLFLSGSARLLASIPDEGKASQDRP